MKIAYKKPKTTVIPLQMQTMLSESNVIPPGHDEPVGVREHNSHRDGRSWDDSWDD